MAIVFTNVNVNVTNKGKYIWFLETIIILRNLFKQPVVKQRNIIQLYNLKRKKNRRKLCMWRINPYNKYLSIVSLVIIESTNKFVCFFSEKAVRTRFYANVIHQKNMNQKNNRMFSLFIKQFFRPP